MSFASIAGFVLDVQTQGTGEATPKPIGQRRRTWNGGVRTGEVDDIRSWTLPCAPVTEAVFQSFRAATRLGVAVTCVGDFTNGVSIPCVVDIVSAAYFRVSIANPMMRVMTLAIEEA